MQVLLKFDDSGFWQRPNRFDNDDYKGDLQAAREMTAYVNKVVGQTEFILDEASRILTQYTLHAQELRELPLKIMQKGEVHASGDGNPDAPRLGPRTHAAVRRNCTSRSGWGADEETGPQWLLLTDNGVGMTEQLIKNYFMQIGKSYYRSLECNQERAARNAADEVVRNESAMNLYALLPR